MSGISATWDADLLVDRDVVICECFARDGLQHENAFIPTDTKVSLLDEFSRVGFARIEATSLAHPKYVPQFGDAEEILRRIERRSGTRYKATCANLKAVERAIAAQDSGFGPEEISFLMSATDSHAIRNIKRSREEQWRNVEEMAERAHGRFVLIGSLSVVFGCPFEGDVDPRVVISDVKRFASLGVHRIALGDTAGLGNPKSVEAMMGAIRDAAPDSVPIAHFHNTRGAGLANCVAALRTGVTHFDSSIGGIGGHPAKIRYGEGNTGNVATEDLVAMFEAMGVRTGLDSSRLMAVAHRCEEVLERELLGMITRTSYAGTSAPGGNLRMP